ncbi:DUF2706 domain-containing protein [Rickettsia endosymbiont of Cardiosporidium cionae]|uniref:DUF2706 domain-containing protein n=1 Tax=Rickettsia endosymbiont of Cardiosporidium cionae TaxID=2777155 RepID=UPI001E34E67E|nr:DUF2706 domain-containing protein [Rickettsia endosymbiont of Cardiosporidium cionae]KAF8818293.1 hypothetical protein IHI24_000752 [Rickettsia endosymbiont of Cardiosporidium cionae]
MQWLLAVVFCINILSCVPGPPQELKSPCVAADSFDLFGGSLSLDLSVPCIRYPVNDKHLYPKFVYKNTV